MQFHFDRANIIAQIRAEGQQSGYDAFMASVFVANPWAGHQDAYEAWGDGYDLGVLQAREVLHNGGYVAANDNFEILGLTC